MKERVLSVGIDIGTSTMQLIFSRLLLENRTGNHCVPKIEIVEKKVVYQSHIYRTPLCSAKRIDAEDVSEWIRREYRKANIIPADVQTGAVIITGETARKENADEVLAKISDMAGDFVVASAGPDLEAVLSAKGAGTDLISKKKRMAVVNIDIGGGTSNLALFENGRLKGTSCLDIGGRLIIIDQESRITYLYPKIKKLAQDHGITICEWEKANQEKLYRICKLMADQLAQAIHLKTQEEGHKDLYTNGGSPIPSKPNIQAITYSGGVAKCMEEKIDDWLCYGDIGMLLAKAICEHPLLKAIPQFSVKETIRATVVGAGNHTTEVSGSTISYARELLPLKNLPVLRISKENEADLRCLQEELKAQIPLFCKEGFPECVAIAFDGGSYIHYREIESLAEAILSGAEKLLKSARPLVLVLRQDIGKVLGQILQEKLENRKKVICIDGVMVEENSYLDIGEPLVGGHIVPIVMKTLIFNT